MHEVVPQTLACLHAGALLAKVVPQSASPVRYPAPQADVLLSSSQLSARRVDELTSVHKDGSRYPTPGVSYRHTTGTLSSSARILLMSRYAMLPYVSRKVEHVGACTRENDSALPETLTHEPNAPIHGQRMTRIAEYAFDLYLNATEVRTYGLTYF